MRKRRLFGFLAVVLCFVLATGCNFFKGHYTIEKFDEKLLVALQETYGLTVPETAGFLEGHIDLVGQDPSIVLYFTLPEDDVEAMMSADWKVGNVSASIYDEPSDKEWYYLSHATAGKLYVTAPDENGQVTALFIGDAPSTKWIE